MPIDTDFFRIADENTIFLATDNIEPQRKSKTGTDLGAYWIAPSMNRIHIIDANLD